MLDKDIDAQKYKEIKEEYETKIRRMENQIREGELMNSSTSEQLQFTMQLLPNLGRYHGSADLKAKRQIIGSIYTEK